MTQPTSAQLSIRVGERQVEDAETLNRAWNGCTAHDIRGVHEIITILARDIMRGPLLEQALMRGNGTEAAKANQQARTFHAAALAHGNIHWSISQASRHRGGEAELRLWAPNPDGSGEKIGVSIPFANFASQAAPRSTAHRPSRPEADIMEDLAARVRAPCDEAIAAVNHALHGHAPHSEDPHHRGSEEDNVSFGGGIPRRGGWGLGSRDGLGSEGEASSESESSTRPGRPKGGGGHPSSYSVRGSSDSSTVRSRRYYGRGGSGPKAKFRSSGSQDAENQAHNPNLIRQVDEDRKKYAKQVESNQELWAKADTLIKEWEKKKQTATHISTKETGRPRYTSAIYKRGT